MKMPASLFSLSTVFALLAVLLVLNAVVFPHDVGAALVDYDCFPTPRSFSPSPCGCPVGGTNPGQDHSHDFCDKVLPLPTGFATTITHYYCLSVQQGSGLSCTENTRPCGVSTSFIWRCTHFRCGIEVGPPPGSWSCTWTSKNPNNCADASMKWGCPYTPPSAPGFPPPPLP